MSDDRAPTDRDYDAALESVRHTLGELANCNPQEAERLQQDFADLEEMTRKLQTGRIDVAVFGEVSTGKSALINALVGQAIASVSVRGGWTREVWHVSWDGCAYCVPGFADSQIVLIDTPGINEIDGQARSQMARQAAQRADLILFVTDSDLNDTEFMALGDLGQANRPIIVVLNKSDLYSAQQREELLDALRSKCVPTITAKPNIVATAADPRPIEYLIESSGGATQSEVRKPEPDVEALKLRILEVLEKDGKALLALNAAMFAADKNDRIVATRVRMRQDAARRLIWSSALTKAVAVAANPVPIGDVAAGTVIDVGMVIALGRIYKIELTKTRAMSLMMSILEAAGMITVAHLTTYLAASLLKGLSGGMSTAITAPLQIGAAGYGSYVVGQAAQYYFEHDAGWGGKSAKAVVTQILKNTDRHSVIAHLKEEIRRKLRRHPKGAEHTEG